MVAETASGGEIIPPSKKPNANVKPGMIAKDANATTQDVRSTIRNAKLAMILLHFQNSFQDICQAASYRSGGRKIKNISSGSIVSFENPSVKLNANPPNTSIIG